MAFQFLTLGPCFWCNDKWGRKMQYRGLVNFPSSSWLYSRGHGWVGEGMKGVELVTVWGLGVVDVWNLLLLFVSLKLPKPPWDACLSLARKADMSHWWPCVISCPCSDLTNGADGMLATSSSGSQYSGSRVETPVSYVGEDDDEDEEYENDEEDWCVCSQAPLPSSSASGKTCLGKRNFS